MNGNSLKPEDAPASIYGPDGAPQFFQDPAMDRFVAVVLNLASELWVQTERVERLQQLVADNGLSGSAPDTPAFCPARLSRPGSRAAPRPGGVTDHRGHDCR